MCRSKQIKVHCGLFFLCVQACVSSAGKIDGCMNVKNAVIRKTSHGSRYNDLLGCRHAHAHTHKLRMGSKRGIKKNKFALSYQPLVYFTLSLCPKQLSQYRLLNSSHPYIHQINDPYGGRSPCRM